LINHNQVFFSHLSVIDQFIASDFWLVAYCRKPLIFNIILCWIYNEVAVSLRLCDWPIREESIVHYAQRLVRRRVATILRPHY